MKPCPNIKLNMEECPCDYPGCEHKGICCECVRHHRKVGGLPACLKK